MRLELATQRAQAAIEAVQAREPGFQPSPAISSSDPEGRIAAQEAIAAEAEARAADLARGVVPGTNTVWGVNRLTKELYAQGYRFYNETDSPGLEYRNYNTGETVRIMERPPGVAPRSADPSKYQNDYYYRYNYPGRGDGDPITIPNK